MTTETVSDRERVGTERPPARPRGRRRRWRRFLVVSHRWLSLVLGLALLVITVTGIVLVYDPELRRAMDSAAYDTTDGAPQIGYAQALATVEAEVPDFEPADIVVEHGVYRVTDYETSHTVDPVTGDYLGEVGAAPWWLGFSENLHMCLLSCEDLPGYLPALAAEVPHTGWLGYEDTDITVAGLVLGLLGVLLVYLCVTGLWLWFPRPSRWREGFTVRRGRGRFARDTDLHKVVGIAALVPLLVWGVTGAGFELEPVEDGWYAVTPGQPVPESTMTLDEDPENKAAGRPIGPDEAVQAALAGHPGARPVSVSVLPPDDPTASYSVWLTDGVDPYAHGEWPGDVGVSVNPYTGEALTTWGTSGEPVAQTAWDSWSYPVHAGIVVNGWWRSLWFLLALAPIVLAVTGVSTWLVRRRTRRARRLAGAAS